MFSGMGKINPKQMQQMMKQMGISTEEIPAKEVHILMGNGKMRKLQDVSVSIMTVQGQKTYTITGGKETEETDIPAEDVAMVASAAGVSQADAKKALQATDGDIAKAIEQLKE